MRSIYNQIVGFHNSNLHNNTTYDFAGFIVKVIFLMDGWVGPKKNL